MIHIQTQRGILKTDSPDCPGGLPIIVDGHLIGGIGVGSGSGAQDLEVAKVGIAALAGAQSFD